VAETVAEKAANLLESARRLYREAVREFESGVGEGGWVRIAVAVEKASGAVEQATKALVLMLKGKLPSSWEEDRVLVELETSFPEVARLRIRDRYAARLSYLSRFRYSLYSSNLKLAEYELEKVKEYLDDISRLLKQLQ